MKKMVFAALFVSAAGCWYSGADCVKACGDKGVLLCTMDRIVCDPSPRQTQLPRPTPEIKGDVK